MKNALRGTLIFLLTVMSISIPPVTLSPAMKSIDEAVQDGPLLQGISLPPVIALSTTTSETFIPKIEAPVEPTFPAPAEIVFNTLNQISLLIPKIELETSVIPVGVNDKGEMDVPDGTTNAVGWYEKGVKPGEIGSAVLDAHVYAAFKELNHLKPGDAIYIKNEKGENLHFVVESTQLAPLEDTSTYALFERKDKARLNLITCAGTYVPSRGTYDKRLVVYAVLVS